VFASSEAHHGKPDYFADYFEVVPLPVAAPVPEVPPVLEVPVDAPEPEVSLELVPEPELGMVDELLDPLGLVLEAPLEPPDAPELLGDDIEPDEEPDVAPMPDDEPDVLPVPAVPHAVNTSAHARGMVHFIIQILLENNP